MLNRYFAMTRGAMKNATAIVASTQAFLKWGLSYAEREISPLDRCFYLGYPAYKQPQQQGSAILQAQLSRSAEKLIFTYIGSFGASYELSLVCEAARRAHHEGIDNIRFLIAGKGDQENALKAKYGDLQNLRFLGWLNQTEIRLLLRATDVGLIPCRSVVGAAPNKVFEYLSCGIPVISSLEGEMKALFQRRRIGYSYQSGDGMKLFQNLRKLAESPELIKEMSGNARKVFGEMFVAEDIYRAYGQLVEDVAATYSASTVKAE